MADMTGGFDRPPAIRQKQLEYRIYFGIVYAASLPLAVGRWLLPGDPSERTGVFGEARRMTNTVIPYIFMR